MNQEVPRRVLLVIGSLRVGGAEHQLTLLAQQLITRGWSVKVFALEKQGPLISGLERAGVQILDGGYRSTSRSNFARLLSLARSEAWLLSHILRWRPHVVHAFLPLTNFMGAVAGRLAFVPVVVTSKRGLGTHQDRHPRFRWLDRLANRMSHIVTANSRAVAKDTEERDGYDAKRIHVIANGLDFSRFEVDVCRTELRRTIGLEKDDYALVLVANLIPYKGHAELIDALHLLKDYHPRLKVILIGDDRGIRRDLIRHASVRQVAERVIMLGRRDDIPALLAVMDVGVLPSHEEGLSNALLEKLAAGLPVVATDAGGNAEALEGMPDCRLVRPRDASDLARNLGEVLLALDAARSNRLVRRQLIRERYSVATMVHSYERIYLEALN